MALKSPPQRGALDKDLDKLFLLKVQRDNASKWTKQITGVTENHSQDCFRKIGQARSLFYLGVWNLYASKPNSRICVHRKSSSHVDSTTHWLMTFNGILQKCSASSKSHLQSSIPSVTTASKYWFLILNNDRVFIHISSKIWFPGVRRICEWEKIYECNVNP